MGVKVHKSIWEQIENDSDSSNCLGKDVIHLSTGPEVTQRGELVGGGRAASLKSNPPFKRFTYMLCVQHFIGT